MREDQQAAHHAVVSDRKPQETSEKESVKQLLQTNLKSLVFFFF